MKLIKLHRGHKLYREDDCVYAWRFDTWCQEATQLEKFLEQKYGSKYGIESKWSSRFGSPTLQEVQNVFGGTRMTRYKLYWIGIKDARDLPFLLLQINDLQAT